MVVFSHRERQCFERFEGGFLSPSLCQMIGQPNGVISGVEDEDKISLGEICFKVKTLKARINEIRTESPF